MLYFAYGSNLSTVRLTKRVPSAELIETGQLNKHRLLFHKIGRDGSAKCDAYFTDQEDDFLYGALFRINPEQKKHLDQTEGLGNGYEIKQVTVVTESAETFNAFTYFATRTASDIKPFHWYKEHVLSGAREHFFPEQYIEQITRIASTDDENRIRTEQELSIYSTDSPLLL